MCRESDVREAKVSGEAEQAPGKSEQRLAEIVSRFYRVHRDPWKLWDEIKEGGFTEEQLRPYQHDYGNPKARVRGLQETNCRVDYSTGEIYCPHGRQAPKNLDCRQAWCLHAKEMRTRLERRLRKHALARKTLDGQS